MAPWLRRPRLSLWLRSGPQGSRIKAPTRLPRQRGVCLKSLVLSLGSPCSCCFSKINKCSVERAMAAGGRAGRALRGEEGAAGAAGGCRAGEGSRQGRLGARTRRGHARRPRRRWDSTHPCRGAEPLQTRKTRGFVAHESFLSKAVPNCLAELQLHRRERKGWRGHPGQSGLEDPQPRRG